MSTTLHWLDWLVIAVYFAGIVAVGLFVSRRVKKTEDYFLGNRSFSVWLMLAQSFGVGTHAEMPVALAGGRLSVRLLGDLVPVEKSLHHAFLLASRAAVPPHAANDARRGL